MSQASKVHLEETLENIFEKVEVRVQKIPKVKTFQQSTESWTFWLKYPDLIKTSEYETLFALIFKKAYDKKLKSLNLPKTITIATIVTTDLFQDALDFSELEEENLQLLFREIHKFMSTQFIPK
ncbi:MAG: hypothetical protein NZ530_05250 [Thermodesulfobacteriaceae bacterium]|nr:hypothetical protein [Thermodesulfobacteriaceae bacterium]MCX8040952.1 hypothetical protein [Thermodesulfobacteriaceae bacterium]MDW8135692.1 hypothetical protein [Thermodesulfobacterium sp.]